MDIERTQQFLIQTESAAQEILISKDALVALDFRRQKTREAFRALKNDMIPGEKAWMSVGNIFVKTRTLNAQKLLEREMKELDKDISDLHNKLKEQVKTLRDLEGKPELKGFDLKPITKEAEVIMKVLSN
ncbi:p53 and DNA damage-regulated protein 1-like [Daphnia carinata]|uniref:p53 and DNA damage-regulated protein 1-like n=1 Tax=Daphnia carinata TaxID=120202 RepID=UPI00257B96C2|nr:p53 and DNA damage-regulated protein 1-like [Daphnia carinata]